MTRRHIVLVSQIPLWSMGRATGGPALNNTLRELGKRYRVSLVTPQLEYVDPADLPPGVELHPFKHRLHGLWRQVRKLGWVTDTIAWFTFQWSAWPIVKRLCKAGDVDLLYGYEIYGVPVCRKAADRFGIPMVARYQGTTMCFRQHEPLTGLRYLKHWRALKTPADLYIMTDDGSAGDRILTGLGHPRERIFFPMNGMDLSIAESEATDVRTQLSLPAEVPLFITVSRLVTVKRVDRAVAAVAELVRRGSNAHLAILGVGPLEGALRKQAEDGGITDRVHFVGGAARHELAGYYRAATALLAFGHYSNLGNPLYEAMILGAPIITLAEGETDHLVHDGVNGFFVYDPDPVALADALEAHLADSERLAAVGEQAAAWIRDNIWTWEGRMQAEIDRLEQLMEASR